MELETRNLFIDTQFFMDKAFDFGNKELTALCQLVKDGLIKVYLTDITDREILKKLNDDIQLAVIKIHVSDARMLKAIPAFRKFLDTYNEKTVYEFFHERYYKFKKACKIKIVSSENVNVLRIYDNYCRQQPPFRSTTTKNRKGEFPDAFALAAIENWAEKSGEKAYLISGDTDWEQFASENLKKHLFEDDEKRFFYLKDLPPLLDLVIRHEEKLRNAAAFADRLVTAHGQQIVDAIKEALSETKFDGYGDQSDIEINKSYILNLKVDDFDLLSVNRERAFYRANVQAEYIFKYEIPDYQNAHWDPVDKDLVYIDKLVVYKKHTEELLCDIDLRFKDGIATNFKIASIDAPTEVGVVYDNGEFTDPVELAETLPVIVCGVKDGRLTERGDYSQKFVNIKAAQEIFPELNIFKSSERFTHGLGNRINEEIRFETWAAARFYSE